MDSSSCKICEGRSVAIGVKSGAVIKRDFHLVRCESCGYVSVADPCTDYARLYDEDYYRGLGADPLVDYAAELDHPDQTIRHYEWRGLVALMRGQLGRDKGLRWLDHGSGAGGLVRYACGVGMDAVGFDTGAFAPRARERGVPMISADELDASTNAFDVVTMIEVIEHVVDPIALLRQVARVLRPGGLLFVTTGNVAPKQRDVLSWAYVIPDIHVGYFTPRSLSLAYERVGLRVVPGHYGPGWTDILRFKILKNLHVRSRSVVEAVLPWPILARLADRHVGVTAQPMARKP